MFLGYPKEKLSIILKGYNEVLSSNTDGWRLMNNQSQPLRVTIFVYFLRLTRVSPF